MKYITPVRVLLVVIFFMGACHGENYYSCTCRVNGVDSAFRFPYPDMLSANTTQTKCDSVQHINPQDSCFVGKQYHGVPM